MKQNGKFSSPTTSNGSVPTQAKKGMPPLRVVPKPPAGGRVGKMLAMLESNGGWEMLQREVKQHEEREEVEREKRGLSPRVISTTPSLGTTSPLPTKPVITITTTTTITRATTHATRKPQSYANNGAHAPKHDGAFKAVNQGLKPERRILAYGLGSVQGMRPTMEDAHVAFLELPKNPHIAFFGVYDGHAGDESAHYAADNLHEEIDREIEQAGKSSSDWPDAVLRAFSNLDLNLMEESESMMWTSGTTVICAAYHKEERSLLVANLGDSRCVMCRYVNGQVVAEALSSDHKPNNPAEQERINKAGYKVSNGRINATHAVSRALGDFELKNNINIDMREQAVSNEPELQRVDVTSEDLFLVLACDGLFDVMKNQEVVEWVYERLASTSDSLDAVAKKLANHAVDIGSTDNVSVLIVTLPQQH